MPYRNPVLNDGMVYKLSETRTLGRDHEITKNFMAEGLFWEMFSYVVHIPLSIRVLTWVTWDVKAQLRRDWHLLRLSLDSHPGTENAGRW